MGITFKANVGIDMTAINFSNFFYGTPMKATSSEYVLKYGNGFRDEFEGHGFKYSNAGLPTGGRVEHFAEFKGSKELFSIDGLNTVVTSIVNAAKSDGLQDDARLILRAMSGNDTVIGSNKNDLLYGAGGQDEIDGRGGRDTIVSGPGADTLIGGGGSDWFVFLSRAHSPASNQADVIEDFRQGDKIHLSEMGSFDFIGNKEFTGGHQVSVDKSNGMTLVEVNFDGDKQAEMVIKLNGAPTLDVHDFVL